MEKKKIIEERKEFQESKKQRNEDTKNVLMSIENAYRDKIEMLKDNLKARRKERHVAGMA